ncbi:hypothetical protein C5167_022231, partial [Papaver somniferum]
RTTSLPPPPEEQTREQTKPATWNFEGTTASKDVGMQWELVRVYTKPQGQQPEFSDPVVLSTDIEVVAQ